MAPSQLNFNYREQLANGATEHYLDEHCPSSAKPGVFKAELPLVNSYETPMTGSVRLLAYMVSPATTLLFL